MSEENQQSGDTYTKPVDTKKTPRIGRSFSSRNPTPIGAIGLVFIIALLFAAFNAAKLPLIGGGTPYAAYFTESANLKEGDDVRIAGVKVGTVDTVSLDGPRVKVSFSIKDGWVGDQSNAFIKLKTLLGAKFVDIESSGSKQLKSGSTIPLSRTKSPFDVYPAFTSLTKTIQNLNIPNIQKSFETLSGDFRNTPKSVRPVVTGLSRLSMTIASRDTELRLLLSKANDVTGVLASRDTDLQRILSDGNLLLAELNKRRDAIHSLLLNTVVLSDQLRGLVNDNQATIGPLLDNVQRLTNLLLRNQDSLDRGLGLLGPFYRLFNNVIGNGRWFDNYIQNLSTPGLVGLLGLGKS